METYTHVERARPGQCPFREVAAQLNLLRPAIEREQRCHISESDLLYEPTLNCPAARLATDEFPEGWTLLRGRSNAQRAGKRRFGRGMEFCQDSDESLRSGVGDTRMNIAGRSNSLRRIQPPISNAAEWLHIELTEYPWFFLARVRVYPYSIQRG